MNGEPDPPIVRPATETDIARIVELITEHADYERAEVPTVDRADELARTLLGPLRRAACYVAANGDEVVGYCTASIEFSTWNAGCYLHMDTLYVDEEHRGEGIGTRLLDAARRHGLRLGLGEMQWQTPAWNKGAVRFYQRIGATGSAKTRFTLTLQPIGTDRTERSNRETLDLFSRAWEERVLHTLRRSLHRECRCSASVGPEPGTTFSGIDDVLDGIAAIWEVDHGSMVELGPPIEAGAAITRTWTYRFTARPPERGIDLFTFEDGLIIHRDAYRKCAVS